jgi:hypothetical protein
LSRLKPYKFRKLIAALQDYDSKFVVFKARGKGSERMIYHPNINGRAASYPVRCHGEGDEIPIGTLKAIIRRFDLPSDLL